MIGATDFRGNWNELWLQKWSKYKIHSWSVIRNERKLYREGFVDQTKRVRLSRPWLFSPNQSLYHSWPMKDLKNWRYTLYCHYSLMKITSLHSWRTIFGALPKRTFHKDVIMLWTSKNSLLVKLDLKNALMGLFMCTCTSLTSSWQQKSSKL